MGDSCDPVNRLFYLDLRGFDGGDVSTLGRVVKLVDNFDSQYQYITNEGRIFWFKSNLDAPRCKVVKMQLPPVGNSMEEDVKALAQIPKVVVVPEEANGVLKGAVSVAGNKLILVYERDAFNQMELCDLAGENRTPVVLPDIGSISGVHADKKHDDIMFCLTNFNPPGTIFHGTVCSIIDKVNGGKGMPGPAEVKVEVFRKTDVEGIDPSEFETQQVRYMSKDGTEVPMFVVGRRGHKGPAPCLLYGYGGFNISITPTFSLSRLLFVKHFGGRFCVANIRGGGEYGEDWHEDGTMSKKQNVFDDFIAAAQYLVDTKVTTKAQLAINGGSNGGLVRERESEPVWRRTV
ncbi:unnamed protein product [Discosporangium mesarthrocarpum]